METKTNRTPSISNITSIQEAKKKKKGSCLTYTQKMTDMKGSIASLGKLGMSLRDFNKELPFWRVIVSSSNATNYLW